MSLSFFAIPACGPAAAETELNHLRAASRVLAVERHFVANDEALFWAVGVRIASGHDHLPEALKADQGSARRVDYREVLSEADLGVFAKVRELRRSIAESEGVLQYAVFTREVPRQPQREPGISLCPELDGGNGMDLPKTMDQTRRPAGTDCRAGEPQGARGAGRRPRWMPAPTAPRVADSAYRPAAR